MPDSLHDDRHARLRWFDNAGVVAGPVRPSAGDRFDQTVYWVARRPWMRGLPILAIGALLFFATGYGMGARTWHEDLAWMLCGLAMTISVPMMALSLRQNGRSLMADAHALSDLRALSFSEFEELVAEVFRFKGWDAWPTQRGVDGGADIVLQKGRRRALVQCKNMKRNVATVEIRAFFGVMKAEKVDAGYFVTTSDFWPDAERFAASVGIETIRGQRLLRFLSHTRDASSSS